MPKDEPKKTRKRVVVEEIKADEPIVSAPPVADFSINSNPASEIKEKVEELQTLTEGISQSVEKSSEVQEEIAKVANKVETSTQMDMPVNNNQNPNDFMPLEKMAKNGPNPLLIIIPGVLLLGALLGGIVFYQNSVKSSPEATPSPSDIVAVSSPTPTPTPAAVDLSKYTISVFNGSGIPGEAGKVKTLLEAADFKVGSTANAATYDYTKTVIKVKKSTVDTGYIGKLVETLSKTYIVDQVQELSTSSKDEVQVVVGTSKK